MEVKMSAIETFQKILQEGIKKLSKVTLKEFPMLADLKGPDQEGDEIENEEDEEHLDTYENHIEWFLRDIEDALKFGIKQVPLKIVNLYEMLKDYQSKQPHRFEKDFKKVFYPKEDALIMHSADPLVLNIKRFITNENSVGHRPTKKQIAKAMIVLYDKPESTEKLTLDLLPKGLRKQGIDVDARGGRYSITANYSKN